MSDHPDLTALLRGELSNADVAEVADHLDRCEECRGDVADTAVDHALLTATRTLSRPAPLELPEVPPLSFPMASPRAGLGLRPLGLIAAAALVAGTAVASPWADGPTRRSRPRRLPSGPPTSSRSTATGRAAW